MVNTTGLVDRVQATILTFRDNATPGAALDFRALAVDIVRVFRDFIGDELKKPDAFDTDELGKGQQGLE